MEVLMLNQEAWVNVVTNPLGMSAFALFLVFLVLTRTAISRERRWLSPVFVGIAVIALLGGLALSYKSYHAEVVDNVVQPHDTTLSIQAETHGDKSPVIGTVGGDVNIGGNTSDVANDSDK